MKRESEEKYRERLRTVKQISMKGTRFILRKQYEEENEPLASSGFRPLFSWILSYPAVSVRRFIKASRRTNTKIVNRKWFKSSLTSISSSCSGLCYLQMLNTCGPPYRILAQTFRICPIRPLPCSIHSSQAGASPSILFRFPTPREQSSSVRWNISDARSLELKTLPWHSISRSQFLRTLTPRTARHVEAFHMLNASEPPAYIPSLHTLLETTPQILIHLQHSANIGRSTPLPRPSLLGL